MVIEVADHRAEDVHAVPGTTERVVAVLAQEAADLSGGMIVVYVETWSLARRTRAADSTSTALDGQHPVVVLKCHPEPAPKAGLIGGCPGVALGRAEPVPEWGLRVTAGILADGEGLPAASDDERGGAIRLPRLSCPSRACNLDASAPGLRVRCGSRPGLLTQVRGSNVNILSDRAADPARNRLLIIGVTRQRQKRGRLTAWKGGSRGTTR